MAELTRFCSHVQKISWSVLIAVAVMARPADSCAFHYYTPANTAVDWLTDASDVILARPSETSLHAYETVKVLKGVGPSVQLPHPLSTTMRTRMERNANDYALFVRSNERSWKYVTVANPAYVSVVEKVLAEFDNWGTGYGPNRFSLFAELLHHPDPAIKKLALQEVDKAPYELLRSLEMTIPAEELLDELWKIQEYDLRSIRILLLGLTDEDSARDVAYRYFKRTKKWSDAKNLGAFATAVMELDGSHGVNWLDNNFLSDSTQNPAKIEQVIEAMAIHSSIGTQEMRTTINVSLDRLVESRPETALVIARQFEKYADASPGEITEQLPTSTVQKNRDAKLLE